MRPEMRRIQKDYKLFLLGRSPLICIGASYIPYYVTLTRIFFHIGVQCPGVDVGNFHLTDINYADDVVLFTDDPTK